MSYEITFGGRFQAGLNITTGKVVVKAGSLYLPATTANVALYPIAGLVVRYQQVPSANYDVGDIAHAGVWPSSLTGLTAATAGVATYARVTSTGSLENVISTALVAGDQLLGRINTDGDLILAVAQEYLGVEGTNTRVVVNLLDYGSTEGASADDAAWDACLTDVPILGIDRVEHNGFMLTRPLKVLNSTAGGAINSLEIGGTQGGTDAEPGLSKIKIAFTERSGAAASLTSVAGDLGAVDPEQGNIKWNAMLLTGINHGGDAEVGDKVRLSNCANAAHNCNAVVVSVPDNTSLRVSISGSVATTDANNGTIEWLLLKNAIQLHGRGHIFEDAQIEIQNGSYVYSAFSVTNAAATGALSVSELRIRNIRVQPTGNGVCEYGCEIGAFTVPTSGHPNSVTESSGYLRPWSPTQCDFIHLHDFKVATDSLSGGGVTSYLGGLVRCANTSGQSRGNVFYNCAAIQKEYIIDIFQDFPSGKLASMGIDDSFLIGGVITKDCLRAQQDQGAIVINYLHVEQLKRICTVTNSLGTLNNISINGGYFALTDTGDAAVDMTGMFVLDGGCHIKVRNLDLLYAFTPITTGALARSSSGGITALTFENCTLPAPDVFGAELVHELFTVTNQPIIVTLTNCKLYSTTTTEFNTTPSVSFPVTTLGYPLVAEHNVGSSLLVRGLSNTNVPASNFVGTVTISGATDTTGVWEFNYPEIDDSYDSHGYEVECIPITWTGTPAAGAFNGRVPPTGKARRWACLTLDAAPGGGNSITYCMKLIRHTEAAATAFHPGMISGLRWWFNADYDWNYSSRKILGVGDTGIFWRNQASVRAYASIPRADMAKQSVPSWPADPAVDAGYNNKKVVSTTTDAHLVTAYAHASLQNIAAPYTVYYAGEPGTGAGLKYALFMYTSSGADDDTGLFVYNNLIRLGRWGASYLTGTVDWSGKQVICGVVNGASSELYISSLTADVTGTCSPFAASSGGYTTMFNGSGPFRGTGTSKTQQMLVYEGAHTTAQRTSVTNWLGAYIGKTIAP